MKRVLGLDLGTNSIGWALVDEASNENEKSKIVKLGVRVNPLTSDEKKDFESGNPLSTNASRTMYRGARRNLQRYKLRRKNLIDILITHNLISKETPLTEIGKGSTYETLKLRAKAANEKVNLTEFARILLAINKKRGYKSSRKVNNDDEGQAIDGMSVAKTLYDENLTPGQYVLQLLYNKKKYIPDFYRSDLQNEFDRIWETQKEFYPQILTSSLYENLKGKNKTQTWSVCKKPFNIVGIKLEEKGDALKIKKYELRTEALTDKLDLETLAIVLQEINNDLNQSSGYLGAISDRSKELHFNNETIGQNLWKQLSTNNHSSIKNQVFYRQDYLDEFEQIWETQSKYHKELTESLKKEIRDVIIFYQRKLKSQKGLLGFCQFESWEQNYIDNVTKKEKKRTVGKRVVSKSSPLFQEFKIWQDLNNLEFKQTNHQDKNSNTYTLDNNDRIMLFNELNIRNKLTQNQILKFLGLKPKEWKTNFKNGIDGNRTNASLYNIFKQIAENEGYGHDWAKKSSEEIKKELQAVFEQVGINPNILDFDANAPNDEFEQQESYQLWHLLYSTEDDTRISEEDKSIYGSNAVNLQKTLNKKFGFKPLYTKWLSKVSFKNEYGNLSSKAIRKIIPFLQEGHNYYEACKLAGYNHSNSLSKDENEKRELLDKLDLLPKNSLRNPVVEKILNQMVNLVNQIIETYGKPDEIRIELARELKKTAKERKDMTTFINKRTKENEDIRNLITKEFGIPNPTKNDVVRYRLWLELAINGFKDVFRNKKINKEDLFSKKIDIEHIIPKALLFDDSFSNKTLAFKEDNLKKANRTALDYITTDYENDIITYTSRVKFLYNNGKGTISKAKYNKLLMTQTNLPEGFIERDLRNSQYIAKKAKKILLKSFRTVIATSGTITDKLREDWNLINVMKELNLPKYKALGLTHYEERLNKQTGELVKHEVIDDWTKRNDHRHHAMDALTVAFTTHNHIQYINNLNARKDNTHNKHILIQHIENKITHYVEKPNGKKNRKFKPPMPSFREEAKKQIEDILVSIKAKNKVVTKNKNYTKGGIKQPQNTLTPRGQLHKETVYAKRKSINRKAKKLNKKFTLKQANLIVNPQIKEIVIHHLAQYNNDPNVAFNSKFLKKNPLKYKNKDFNDVVCYEEIYTTRKPITPKLNVDKVVDENIKQILKNRLTEYKDAKKAFSNLETNPIWLNKEKNISIKRVTITGISDAKALHTKKNHLGKNILNKKNKTQAVDYVNTGNNHHVAIYKDVNGTLQENVVSFYEAVERACQKLPIINKRFNEGLGWVFQFSMKQNEMFVFPNDDFDIQNIDLMDEKNASMISKHLFRVQKISSKDYFFRHHLETKANESKNSKELAKITYYRIRNAKSLNDIIKVRINHIGKIVHVGEY